MKQTAVEWLFNEIDMQYPEINVRRKEWIIDKAKKMEKDQIKDSYEQGYSDGYPDNGNSGEQYYKKTYENK
jgi:hypothetical protein